MAQTFPPFAELPPELRVFVWGIAIALESPRVVEVRFGEDPKSRKHDFVANIPAVLHACHESREEGLKVYKLLFRCRNAAHPMYFNPEIDTIFLREAYHRRNAENGAHTTHTCRQASKFLRELPNKDQIQRLMLDFYPAFTQQQTSHNPSIILKFPNLELVTLVGRVNAEWSLCACDCRCYLPMPYCLFKKCDTSKTPVGRTHFLDLAELRSLGIWHCGTCNFGADPMARGRAQILDFLKDFRDDRFGEQYWDPPDWNFVGAVYDRIPAEQFWYTPKVDKVHNTRSRTAMLALENSEEKSQTPQ